MSAERSFGKEVEQLRLGAGEIFHGEGILAVTKALPQSGEACLGVPGTVYFTHPLSIV